MLVLVSSVNIVMIRMVPGFLNTNIQFHSRLLLTLTTMH